MNDKCGDHADNRDNKINRSFDLAFCHICRELVPRSIMFFIHPDAVGNHSDKHAERPDSKGETENIRKVFYDKIFHRKSPLIIFLSYLNYKVPLIKNQVLSIFRIFS